MLFAKLDELIPITERGVRAANPDVSFPEPLRPEHVSELGYLPVEDDPIPELAAGEEVVRGDLEYTGGRIVQHWVVIPAPEEPWPQRIADQRYRHEIAGVNVGGMRVDTDDRSKLLINGAAVEAMLDPDYQMRWKAPSGFVELDAAQVLGVARAIRAHVQACFNREAELLAAVDDGSITDQMLDEGWPNE